jgi:hypothetical protein
MTNGAIYLLSRRVTGGQGEDYMQNVTVFADSVAHAKQIVNDQFLLFRKNSRSREHAYEALPEFDAEKVALDEHKMITVGVTK